MDEYVPPARVLQQTVSACARYEDTPQWMTLDEFIDKMADAVAMEYVREWRRLQIPTLVFQNKNLHRLISDKINQMIKDDLPNWPGLTNPSDQG
jgi:hypothetical protein